MIMRKKLILSFAALMFSLAAMSQVRVGIKGGWNRANISDRNDGTSVDNSAISRYHVGLIVDLPLIKNVLSFQPGAFYSSKGAKVVSGDENSDTYAKYTTNPQYIEVPLNFVGKIPVGTNARLFAGIGPYMAFGVAGKNKSKVSVGGVVTESSSSIKWDDDTPFNSGDPNQGYDKYKRFDIGGNLMVGAEVSNFLISAQYGLGFNKIYSGQESSSDNKSKNRVFSVSVGYLF